MTETRFATHIDDGIERVSCYPAEAAHRTPILFLHGMWHGAWCWRGWQEMLAERGWESHAISLPGHGASAQRKSVRFTSMDDYLAVGKAEITRFPTPPIVIGHSMGGALIQWYLKKVADDLPAAVMVASWTSHSTFADGTSLHLRRDPWGFLRMGFTLSARPLVRSPKWVASLLLSNRSTITPEDLHSRLVEESYLVLSQHNPPAWRPKAHIVTPMLWAAAEEDAVISLAGARASAKFYGADFISAPGAHNLMMETENEVTLGRIADWLAARKL